MESAGETCELQQLVPNDVDGENDDNVVQDDYTINEEKITSPIRSNKISSSGTTSHSSVSRRGPIGGVSESTESKLFYINEKKASKDYTKTSTVRPRNPHKVPDVRHMEQALLGLLADFHSGKLRAFGSGSTMDQMTNIREQQEKLAKLHFDLGAASDASSCEDGLKHSRNTMNQLIERLEQLSVSIEKLHSNSSK